MHGILWLVASAIAFSVMYGFIEYYVIQDTTFGYDPVLFSLLYPYHFAMAAVFGLTSYGLLSLHASTKGIAAGLVIASALFSSMLAVEDFTWFSLRAFAPLDGDANAGRLVMQGEWTTRFMGSVDAHFTEVPNWYFMGAGLSAAALVLMRSEQRLAAVAST